jgi:3-oxoacyl-[acyl-carrier protein] reductase
LTSLGIGASLVNHDIIFSDPEEVAHMTLSLCLPAASFLTGAILPVDGGLMARNA